MDELEALFANVQAVLRSSMSETIYNVWFNDMKFVAFEDTHVVLSTVEYKRRIIEQRFMDQLRNAFEKTFGFDVDIVFEDAGSKTTAPRVVQYNETPATDESRPADDENTFDNFIIGSSNKFAHAAALNVAMNPGRSYNPLFIYGNSGLGKTHLLRAICHEIKRNNPNANIIYTHGEAFANEFIYLLSQNNTDAFHRKYREADVLVVDDVQFIAGKEAVQEEFFHTFNEVNAKGNQIVLSSDRAPREISRLEDRLRSRFDMGLIADVQPPDLETRMAIIKQKANEMHFEISNDVVEFIAEQLKSNIRQLEGAVNRMEAYVALRGMSPSIGTAQNAIKDIANEQLPVPKMIERIIEETARTYGLQPGDLLSKQRNATISKARQVAMYIVSEVTGISTVSIGNSFGRDHSTVVYALRSVKSDILRDSSLRKTVNDIIKNVKES